MMKKQHFVYGLLIYLICITTHAFIQPPPASQVFTLSATCTKDNIVKLHWKIKPKFYLYRDRFHFKLLEPKNAKLGKIILPPGLDKFDDVLGHYQVYENEANINIPIELKGDKAILQVSYQGCSKEGFCYAPVIHKLKINFASNRVDTKEKLKPPLSEQDKITQLLVGHNLFLILSGFFVFGLLLSFTPCVLPMIPIISGIILGHKHLTTRKAFFISLIYVLSMSLTYALAGVLFGYLGASIQTTMQQPWVIISFSLIFVLLALSMFGLYNLELPKKFEEKVSALSNKQKHGSYIGTAIMGVLASLIISPCVTAPLVGVLGYIAQTGNALLGGVALFTMSIGMGIPLLLIGTSGAKLLPKAGIWMNEVKYVIGVLLLAFAIWMLQRILPGPFIMFLWAALLIVSGIFMGAISIKAKTGWQLLWKGIGFIMLIYGSCLVIGAAMGNSNPFNPLARAQSTTIASTTKANHFIPIKNLSELNKALAVAKKQHATTLIDFYADWCIACKEMEANTFTDTKVAAAMNKFVLLQVDVTHNSNNIKEIQQQFSVVAPPTLIFFNKHGKEMKHMRIVGEMGPQQFLAHLQQVLVQANNHQETVNDE